MSNDHYSAYPYPYSGYPHPNGMGGGMSPPDQTSGQWGMPAGHAPQGAYAQGYAHAPMPQSATSGYGVQRQAQSSSSFLNFSNDRFVKGLLIGAAATYLLTNEGVQRTLIKGVVQVWSTLQGGIEEAKERFHDAEAELQHAARSKSEAAD